MDKADPARLEVLRMARELVINEHTDRRAELHNQWLVNSETKWRTHRQRVPYPSIPPYPTEADILSRAQVLFKFIDVEEPAPEPITKAEPVGPTLPVVEDVACEPTGPTGSTQNTGAKEMGEQPKPPKGPPDDDANVTTPEADTPKMAQMPSEELVVAYAEAKVSRDLDDQSTSTGRLIPNVMKKLDEMRRGWNSN